MAVPGGPTKELGSSADPSQVGGIAPYSWSGFAGDSLEKAQPLIWPQSIDTYHQMRNDAQIQGLYLGSTLPIRRYTWYLEPNGAPDNVLEHVSTSLGLPIKGKEDENRRRSKNRFSWSNHLRHVLLEMIYGHMYFEQVGDIRDDGLWHLRKLSPRMPQTITAFDVDANGSLVKIKQAANANPFGGGGLAGDVEIPIERLVAYIWEQEGANWVGRSALRGIYKNWLLKDRVLRVGAINIERGGGVPYIRAPKDADDNQMTELAKMARQFRVGESAGGAIPYDTELKLASAAGGEAVDYIKLMNEEMGRGWLMMFLNLGQTISGSRGLSENFINWFSTAQETIANHVVDVTNEHVIEDIVDWNFGEDVQAPLLTYNRNEDRNLAVADLVSMVEQGVITLDEEIENWIRESYKMPSRDHSIAWVPPSQRSQPAGAPPAAGTSDPAAVQAERVPVRASSGSSPQSSRSDRRIFDHGGDI